MTIQFVVIFALLYWTHKVLLQDAEPSRSTCLYVPAYRVENVEAGPQIDTGVFVSPGLSLKLLDFQAYWVVSSWPMKRRRRSRYWLQSSMSLWPAPSTHSGSTALGQRSNRARPCEKSITSSSVPWMISTGDVIFDTFSMLKEEVGTLVQGQYRETN